MKLKEVLEKQLEKVKLNETELEKLKKKTEEIKEKLENSIKKNKIKAEIFIGGSLAKETLIKKDKYDIDIYVRFNKEEDTARLEKIIKQFVKARKIHGSRDYFQIPNKEIIFEIIPVLKINKPEEARNVTDLSWFHVKYVTDNLKRNPKLRDEIILGKSFAYASGCYGAESYIRGFSGYALELLIIHYGSLEKFLKAINSKERIVITSGFYRNKEEALINVNEAKLSPIIFIDPTFGERNALAALSEETLEKFRKISRDFLRNPSLKFFKIREIDKSRFKTKLTIETDRQEGDIAGTKLRKFYDLFSAELEKFFRIKAKEFEYDGKKKALMLFNLDRKDRILRGPPVTKVENITKFKKKHKNAFVKNGIAYAKEKAISFEKFLSDFKKENKKKMKDMGITRII